MTKKARRPAPLKHAGGAQSTTKGDASNPKLKFRLIPVVLAIATLVGGLWGIPSLLPRLEVNAGEIEDETLPFQTSFVLGNVATFSAIDITAGCFPTWYELSRNGRIEGVSTGVSSPDQLADTIQMRHPVLALSRLSPGTTAAIDCTEGFGGYP